MKRDLRRQRRLCFLFLLIILFVFGCLAFGAPVQAGDGAFSTGVARRPTTSQFSTPQLTPTVVAYPVPMDPDYPAPLAQHIDDPQFLYLPTVLWEK